VTKLSTNLGDCPWQTDRRTGSIRRSCISNNDTTLRKNVAVDVIANFRWQIQEVARTDLRRGLFVVFSVLEVSVRLKEFAWILFDMGPDVSRSRGTVVVGLVGSRK